MRKFLGIAAAAAALSLIASCEMNEGPTRRVSPVRPVTGEVRPNDNGPGSTNRQGRTPGSTITRPRTTTTLLPSDESYDNPYGLNAGKSPKDAGMGASDGGVRFDNSPHEETY